MAHESPQSRVWLVTGESVLVVGDIDQVKTTLEGSTPGFAPLTRPADRIYVHPQHVTHIEDAVIEPPRR
jgi:hypothetical protein